MKKYIGYVYLTTNLINGKKYVGQHKQKQLYKIDSYLGSNSQLLNDIELLGIDNFKKEILHFCKDENELDYYETLEIAKRNCLKSDEYYNVKMKGGHNHCTPETRRKISKAISGEKNGFYGKKHTKESIQKMIESKKGIPAWNKGIPWSDEIREIQKQARKNMYKVKSEHVMAKKVECYDESMNYICTYECQLDACQGENLSDTTIRKYIKNGNKCPKTNRYYKFV